MSQVGVPLVCRAHRMWKGEELGHEGYSGCCVRGCLTSGSVSLTTSAREGRRGMDRGGSRRGEGGGEGKGGGVGMGGRGEERRGDGREVSHVQSSKPTYLYPCTKGDDCHVQRYMTTCTLCLHMHASVLLTSVVASYNIKSVSVHH